MDDVFKALADPHRRALLDALFADDGQTLVRLCTALPHLTRFGVMKHLDVLEAAHLVTTQKVGREKRHYLNPVPIREVHDRWVSKFAEPWAAAMVDLKRDIETTPPGTLGAVAAQGSTEEGTTPWQHHATSSRRTSRPNRPASGKR